MTMPSWHPADLPALPDILEAEMTAEDVLRAHAEMMAKKTICGTCPVAQVMNRAFPDYEWSVGSNDATAIYRNMEDINGAPSLAGAFALDFPTRRYIFALPTAFGHEDIKLNKLKLPALITVRAKKFTDSWTRMDWLATDQNWSNDPGSVLTDSGMPLVP